MAISLGSIFEFVVLVMNAFAILDEKRFLRKSNLNNDKKLSIYFYFLNYLVGWDKIDPHTTPVGVNSIKQQLIMLFYTARNIGVCNK